MKTPALLIIGLFALSLFAGPGLAMAEEELTSTDQLLELMRIDLKKERVLVVGDAMEFTGEEAATFWPIYKEYEAEFTKQGDARLALLKEYAESFDTMTDDKATDLASRALDLETERTALKRRYLEKIATAMSPSIAARFLQVENQIGALLDLQIAAQVPLVEKPQ